MSKKWAFRKGLPQIVNNIDLSKLDAGDVGSELDKLYKRDGKVDPDVLVKEAKPKHSPLHDAFEWNDARWGEIGRRHQAQTLITAVVIIDDGKPQAPEYIHIPEVIIEGAEPNPLPQGDARAGCYHARGDVMNDAGMREYVLRRAISDLVALKNKYDAIKELLGVFTAIDKVVQRLGLTEVKQRAA